MMGPTHRLFGAFCGVTVATVQGQDWPQVVATGLIATATAHGWSSPDMDQEAWFRRAGKARFVLGPLKRVWRHRGITHFVELPLLAWWLITATIGAGDRWVFYALLIGWASHIVGDAIFGKVPVLFGARYIGLGLKTDGILESGKTSRGTRVLPIYPIRWVIIIGTAAVLWTNPTMPAVPGWEHVAQPARAAWERVTGPLPDLPALGRTQAADGPAAASLDDLPVITAFAPGYDRDLFGDAWSDDVTVASGRNGCDTRNDILRRDLDQLTVKDGTNGCVAATGTLNDPYTGRAMQFVRGQDSASLIHIDHVVALGNAWATGADQLDADTRRDLANDPLNLLAVEGSANQAKGDSDAATWLPPNRAARCDYVTTQVQVKAKYGLAITPAEKHAMSTVLAGCEA